MADSLRDGQAASAVAPTAPAGILRAARTPVARRRHEEAWQALREANNVRRALDPYAPADEEDNVRQLLRTFQVFLSAGGWADGPGKQAWKKPDRLGQGQRSPFVALYPQGLRSQTPRVDSPRPAPCRLQLPKPPEQFENETDAVWAALLQGRWGFRDDSLRPVFVVGLPRSGARLLERLLTRHPQVRRGWAG